MAPVAPARSRDGPASKSLPERVGQLYYAYGLFCASHPVAFISLACFVVVFCCYPLLNLPLPGNVPQHHASISGMEVSSVPVWLTGQPVCYVQQVILKSTVSPWTDKMALTDAFRGPLSEVFSLLENIRNYQHENSSRSLSHVCLHVEAVKSRHATDKRHILPEYNCLVLSPANLWHQDFQEFQQDPSLLSTVFTNVNLQRSKISLAEISFGLRLKDTGVKRYPLRSRQRTLQYAVTLILQENDKEYIDGLRKRLSALYPLYRDNEGIASDGGEFHVYYPGEFHWRQLIPLTIMYVMLFLYVYFSARKVELLGSKVGMALSAVITALAAWLMSTGLCCFFGLNLTVSWRESYPYLAMAVGLENVVVVSKSVFSTPPHLDVKIRVAQGLSKEGWSITYNLLTEVTILTFGLFTFVPAIQRFCVFAIFGLLADFFLQMSFISPVLSVVTKREEKTLYRHSSMPPVPLNLQSAQALPTQGTILRSKSHPRLNGIVQQPPERFPTVVVAPVHYAGRVLNKLPKRIRLVHFWARTRFFQRSFMIFMISWIAVIACNSDAIENFLQMDATDREWDKAAASSNWGFEQKPQQYLATTAPVVDIQNSSVLSKGVLEEDLVRLRPSKYDSWDRLSAYHWAAILSLYNISASGRYVTVLPAIHLAHLVSPDDAIRLRNPNEKAVQHFHWETLAAALDPIDFSDGSQGPPGSGKAEMGRGVGELPLTPSSPMELFLLSVLCVVSVGVLAYFMVLLYRCVCSRNYAEWRAGWLPDTESNAESTEVVLQAVPLMLEGHPQEVECIASDGGIVASTCLAGQLRSWDAVTGEALAVVDRRSYFAKAKSRSENDNGGEDTSVSDHDSGSPPAHDGILHLRSNFRKDKTLPNGVARSARRSEKWSFPDLRPAINTNFSTLPRPPPEGSRRARAGYDFGPTVRDLYRSHRRCSDQSDELSDDFGEGLSADAHSPPRVGFEDGVDGSAGVPPVWCADCRENLVVLGCANGRLEFWEGSSGRLKCIYEDSSSSGITSVKLVGNRVVAARLTGFLDFFALESYSRGRRIDWGFTAYRRSHVRGGSAGSLDWDAMLQRGGAEAEDEDIRCVRLHSTRAHQQPISALHSEGGRVLTGSQDHTLKVFRLEDHLPLYTLHGHCGPITCLFIDRVSPMTAGSGSQDGLLCVWDLLSGACMYSIQAHDGAVLSLTYSASYVISLGADDRLCVWERFQGHLLNAIQMVQTYCSSIVMLTHSLLLTSKQGSLVVWDVRAGEPVRMVRLGHSDSCVFVKQLLLMRDGVVCDYANQLRIVRFPLATDKTE